MGSLPFLKYTLYNNKFYVEAHSYAEQIIDFFKMLAQFYVMASTFNGRLEDQLIIAFHYSKLLTHVEVNNWHNNVIFMSFTYIVFVCTQNFTKLPVKIIILIAFAGKWKNIKLSKDFPCKYIFNIYRSPAGHDLCITKIGYIL